MAKPILTAQEISDLQNVRAQKVDLIQTFQAQIVTKTAEIPFFEDRDDLYKSFFDYYNDEIIGRYDNELTALVGTEITSPVTNAELDNLTDIIIETDPLILAALVLTRLFPESPETNITRVPEFDGGGTLVNSFNEETRVIFQNFITNGLQNGFGAGSANTLTTTSTITTSSNSFSTTSPIASPVSNGDVFVIRSSSQVCIIQVTSSTLTSIFPVPPPFTYDINFNFILPPLASIGSGQELYEFSGFSNANRTSKTASFGPFQVLMNRLVSEVQLANNNQITLLTEQNLQMSLNSDPGGTAEFLASTGANNSQISLKTTYLIATDISNAGITSLGATNSSRLTAITAREAQILAAYTGRTENYYEYRYNYANQRASFSGGTLITLKANQKALTSLSKFVQDAQDAVAVIDLLLA